MPFLKITQQEFLLIEEDPEEFVNSSLDICEARESKTIKCQAAELLLALNRNVDGMQTFMIDTCFQIL